MTRKPFPIRKPRRDESPLSAEERAFAAALGIAPNVRPFRPRFHWRTQPYLDVFPTTTKGNS